MTESHRSRTAWPGPMSLAGLGEGHRHDLPRPLIIVLKALVAGILLLVLAVGVLAYFVLQQQAYMEGRGEYRDEEAARIEEDTRLRFCRLLDTLPEGGLLDRSRREFGCEPGNGYPVDEIDPEQRRQQQDISGSNAAPRRAAPQPSTPRETRERIEERHERVPADVRPGDGAGSPPEPPATPEPEPSPLRVVTEPLCDALSVCLEEPLP